MYFEGECAEKNGEEAVRWFTRAAEQGLAGSRMTLAMIYQEGTVVEQNPELARYWLKQAETPE